METWVLSLRLIAGRNVRLKISRSGTVIHFDAPRLKRLHEFRCTLLGESGVRIRPGVVNGVTPLVGKEQLDEERTLEWSEVQLNATGRGWVALEVTLGRQWEVLSAKAVQVADLDTLDGKPPPKGTERPPGYAAGAPLTISSGPTNADGLADRRARHPLALIRRRESGALVLIQHTKHNLLHRAAAQTTATKIARHFFFPAP